MNKVVTAAHDDDDNKVETEKNPDVTAAPDELDKKVESEIHTDVTAGPDDDNKKAESEKKARSDHHLLIMKRRWKL